MKKYVAGFYFSEDRQRVVLIRKNKPEWQKGFLNAVGGKIEKNELAIQAMVREFKEETGVTTILRDWTYFCFMEFPFGSVFFFKAFGDITKCQTMEEEEVSHYGAVPIIDCYLDYNPIHNLKWLIPMALDDKNQDGSPNYLESKVQLS